MKFNETQIGMIGALSVRWPAETASPMWRHLHDVIGMCRQAVISVDQKVSEIEADRTLSDLGRCAKIGDAGRIELKNLIDVDLPDLKGATTLVNNFVAQQEEGALALQQKAGPSTSDDLLAQEIRAFVRKQEQPSSFAFRYRSDPHIYAAIANAPEFLSGMNAEQHKQFIGAAVQSIWPENVKAKTEALSALQVAEKAVDQAERMILERCSAGLMKTGPGQYALKGPKYSTPKNGGGVPRRMA